MAQPTAELQQAITSLHQAIATEPEPEDKAQLAQCLRIMMQVQAKNMQEDQQGGARAQVLGQIFGQQPQQQQAY